MANRKDDKKPNTYVKNGITYIRLNHSYTDENGLKRNKEILGRTMKEAKAKLEQFKAQINNGLNVNLAKRQLREAMDTWLFDVKRVDNDLKSSSFARYECAYRIYIKDSRLGRMKVSDITSINVQQFLNSMAIDLNCTYNQCFNTFKVLRMFFIYAKDEGYTTKNLTKNLTIPGEKKSREQEIEEEKIIALTDAEWTTMKEYMHKKHYLHEFLIQFAMVTGLRKGELLILKYSDIYDGFVHVVRNYGKPTVVNADRTRTRMTVIDDTKSAKGTRNVPLLDEVSLLLEEHRRKQNDYLKSIGLPPSEYIFISESGNLIDPTNLYRSFKRLLIKLGLEDRNFHSIRHTYITNLAQAGVPISTIQELAGHEEINTTMGYITVSDEHKTRAVQCLKGKI